MLKMSFDMDVRWRLINVKYPKASGSREHAVAAKRHGWCPYKCTSPVYKTLMKMLSIPSSTVQQISDMRNFRVWWKSTSRRLQKWASGFAWKRNRLAAVTRVWYLEWRKYLKLSLIGRVSGILWWTLLVKVWGSVRVIGEQKYARKIEVQRL